MSSQNVSVCGKQMTACPERNYLFRIKLVSAPVFDSSSILLRRCFLFSVFRLGLRLLRAHARGFFAISAVGAVRSGGSLKPKTRCRRYADTSPSERAEYRPRAAFLIIAGLISTPRIVTRHDGRSRSNSLTGIASVYGSSPDAQPAERMRSWRRALYARMRSGRTTSAKARKCSGFLKKYVSPTVSCSASARNSSRLSGARSWLRYVSGWPQPKLLSLRRSTCASWSSRPSVHAVARRAGSVLSDWGAAETLRSAIRCGVSPES